MKYSELAAQVVVENIDLTTLTVAAKKDNLNRTLCYLYGAECLNCVGNDVVNKGKMIVPLKYVVSAFFAADDRIEMYYNKLVKDNIEAAETEGTLKKISDGMSEKEIADIIGTKTILKNAVLVGLIKDTAFATITLKKNTEASKTTGVISEYFRIDPEDIVVRISDGFIAELDKTMPKVIRKSFK